MSKQSHSTKVPAIMQDYYNIITQVTDKFCLENLDEDYQTLVRYAVAALCRKRPSPLMSGRANTWACAVLYALGTINFLFDKSNSPYIVASDLAKRFSISKSTAANKAKQVRELLKMHRFDHHWCLPSKLQGNSMAWMITFNGFMMDARELPVEIQEIAYEKGLIPYVCAKKS